MIGSNVFDIQSISKVKRYDRKEKKNVEVNCHSVVVRYNKSMGEGGVDKCDMLISLYRNTMKTTKRVIFQLLDLCTVNSWLLYRARFPDEKKHLVFFRLEVARSLMKYEQIREAVTLRPTSPPPTGAVRADVVPHAVRYDNVGHLPVVVKSKNPPRCKFETCSRRSRTMCVKCKLFLCCDGTSDCFYDFHRRVN